MAKRAMLIGLDGADPVVVKRLMDEGRLPAMKKVLDMGVATEHMDMLGVFPTVTPPNWTTIATGNYPRTHGITCFLNHTLGKDLGITEMNWDSRRVESELIWETFERAGKRAIMLNYCQAWPNRVENSKNIFVDGTGVMPFLRTSADFQKMIYLEQGDFAMNEVSHIVDQNANDCVVYGDQVEEFAHTDEALHVESKSFDVPPLETPAYVIRDVSAEEAHQAASIDRVDTPLKEPKNWTIDLPIKAREAVIGLNKGLARRQVLITAADGGEYDTVSIYLNKKADHPMGMAKVGEWSDWIYDTFNVEDRLIKVAYKIRVIELSADGTKGRFYLSHVCNVSDFTYYYPESVGQELLDHVGPMLYMASFERHTPLGDDIMLESWAQIFQWHIKATQYLFAHYNDWGLFYTHLHGIDNVNHRYINQAIEGSHPDWKRHEEVINRMYEINDGYVQAMLDYLDDETVIIIAADHGAVPRSVGYQNPGIGELSGINTLVMESLGYTVILPEPDKRGFYQIDWEKTRAINHRTSHIYINLKGRDPKGIVEPEDYDDLVQQVIDDLYAYRDPQSGDRVVAFAMNREEMECIGMGGAHCGDVFFQLTKNFGYEHAHAPNHVTNHGYSLGCLCILAGAGLKAGVRIERPIRAVDLVPTICHLCQVDMPAQVEGGIIYQALMTGK